MAGLYEMKIKVVMAMKFRVIKNMIKQGFQGMWRNRSMGLASITSISSVLMILGLVLIMVLSINNLVMDTKTKFDEIQIYIADDVTDEKLTEIEDKIKNNDGVLSVMYESKEQALENWKEDWGDNAYLLVGIETNPLPNSYIIQLKNLEYADRVVDSIKDMDGIEKIQYNKEITENLILVSNYIRLGGIIITGILIFVSIFIISNTIKITVASRRREINIMKYVGATNDYIRGPFIIEGVLFGLIAALISIVIVYYGYGYFFDSIKETLFSMFTVVLARPEAIFSDIAIIFVAIGVGIGGLGSLLSLKRYLNV